MLCQTRERCYINGILTKFYSKMLLFQTYLIAPYTRKIKLLLCLCFELIQFVVKFGVWNIVWLVNEFQIHCINEYGNMKKYEEIWMTRCGYERLKLDKLQCNILHRMWNRFCLWHSDLQKIITPVHFVTGMQSD